MPKYKGGRPKRDYRSASRENFDRFCKEHPSIKITYAQYNTIIRRGNRKYLEYCLDTGDKVKLPYGFGPLSVSRKVTTRYFVDKEGKEHIILPVDWKSTLDDKENPEHKKIYILNFHTEGYRFKWYWFKNESLLKISDIWTFKPAKIAKGLLTKYLTDCNEKHYLKYREWKQRKTAKVYK